MMITSISGLGGASSQFALGEAKSAVGAGASSGTGFGEVMNKVISDAVGTVQTGEATAIQGLQGGVPSFKVVEAVMSAQRTLQSALAIRDKAVSAFQEVTRMAI
jgi:flagellar hook-basal body complex protein FliE